MYRYCLPYLAGRVQLSPALVPSPPQLEAGPRHAAVRHQVHLSRVTCVTCHVSRAMLQVYLYTFTGLHDKPGNHLTQFMGVLLKPLACLPDSSVLTEKPKKRVIMSLE